MFYILRVSMAESISTIKQRLQAKTDFQFGTNLIKFLQNTTLGISVFFLTFLFIKSTGYRVIGKSSIWKLSIWT